MFEMLMGALIMITGVVAGAAIFSSARDKIK